ncbi:MAG TPA: FAD-dependent monooxygenase [Nakamurella sp.]|nr:FAD-dependent monooxygenase [Nakamurella sp.]
MTTQVVIAGAGPTGLMLAAELGLAGIEAIVLEALPAPTGESRALGVNPRAVELWEQRGMTGRFHDGRMISRIHYGALPEFMDLNRLDSPFGVMMIPQRRVEEVLGEWATELGADIRRGHPVTGVRQSDSAVQVTVSGPDGDYELQAQYVVGCDGSRSVVRGAAGIDFPGTTSTVDAVMVDVEGLGLEFQFFRRNDRGLWAIFPIGPDVFRVVVYEFDRPPRRHAAAPDFAEVCEVADRVAGLDLRAGTPRWLSRHGNVTRLADRYRAGRILLAGDAAHAQPPAGGQGVTTGLTDAVNLGWKLAGQLNGWAPAALLDSYHDERRPVGERIIINARVQNLLMSGGLEIDALRTIFTELAAMQEVSRLLAGDLTQVDTRYDLGDAHPLMGRRLTPATLRTAAGEATTLSVLSTARGLLLELTDEPALDTLVRPWGDRVDALVASSSDPALQGLAAVLVRPDGHVVWVAPSRTELDKDGLEAALRRWFGEPSFG